MKCDLNVSVIIPCYQVERYIEESVKSVRNQDFDSFEVIIVDDGTKDNSIEIAVKSLDGLGNYSIVHKENGGLPSARNAGLKAAKGKYVCFIDSDDIISSNHLSSLYNLCETNHLEASCSLFESTLESNRTGTLCPTVSPSIIDRKKLLNGFMDRRLKIHCCSLMINREYLIRNNLYFNENLKYGEDIEFMWRLFPTLVKIGCSNLTTYKYLFRTNSLMTSQNIDRVKLAIRELNIAIVNNEEKYPEDIEIWSLLTSRTYLSFCRSFARVSSYSLFCDLLRETNRFNIKSLILKYPYLKVRILSLVFSISKKMFYRISHVDD